MSSRLFIISSFLVYFFVFPSFSPAHADWLSDILDFINKKAGFDAYIEGSIPLPSPAPTVDPNSPVQGIFSGDPLKQTQINYELARAFRGPFESQTDKSWFDNILERVGLKPNQYGEDFAKTILPEASCTPDTCFPKAQCAYLPYCKDNIAKYEGQPTAPPSLSTPVPTISTILPSPGSVRQLKCPTGSLQYYSQRDPKYADTTFDGPNCSILLGGCGPATFAMILSCLEEPNYSPDKVSFNYFRNWNKCVSSLQFYEGAYFINRKKDKKIITLMEEAKYLTKEDISYWRDIYIRNGYTILASADFIWKVSGSVGGRRIGHIFWIVDIDENGEIYVMDPYYGWNQNTQSPYSIPMKQSDIYKNFPIISIYYTGARAFTTEEAL